MPASRGTWAAVGAYAHHSPQLSLCRRYGGPLSDGYYYRAIAYCKLFCPKGELANHWDTLSVFILWPDEPEGLRDLFRRVGLVLGDKDELWDWVKLNGWLLQKQAKDAKRQSDKRKAGRISARKRRERMRKQQEDSKKVGG